MQAKQAYRACTMKRKPKTQYTIRSVPSSVDRCLREKAKQYNVSLNAAALNALTRGLGLEGEEVIHHDMDDLAGTWVPDPEFDKAISVIDRVDKGMWK